MLIEQYQDWKQTEEARQFHKFIEEERFLQFYSERNRKNNSRGTTLLAELAMNIYYLQVCVEGILEDIQGDQ